VWRLRHRLGTANQTDLGIAEDDFLSSTDYRLKSGAAQSVKRERRGFLAAS